MSDNYKFSFVNIITLGMYSRTYETKRQYTNSE